MGDGKNRNVSEFRNESGMWKYTQVSISIMIEWHDAQHLKCIWSLAD